MALEKYKAKRSFRRTPEPRGNKKDGKGLLRFVVQKHAASRLHYDFRLELDGVLKSWAVPKGPSLDPADKRLAMMVEDHPYEYRTFEGTIPEGNYGAGEVIVWDEGFYSAPGTVDRKEAEKNLREGLEKGDLKFVLSGKKLKGEFVLAKMKSGEENAWLLIKKKDRYASTRDVLADDRSAISARRLPDPFPRARTAPLAATLRERTVRSSRKNDPMPRNVAPMLATLIEEPFDRKGWIFEVKWDGFRAIAEINASDKVRLYSRNQLSFEDRFPEIVRELGAIEGEAVLDGEVVVLDERGRSRFQLIQNFHKKRGGELCFYVFDLLYLNGRDMTQVPLLERKRLLRSILRESDILRYSDHVEERGKDLYREAKKAGLEGIIAKNGGSPYRPGRRGSDWLKVKIVREQEAVIAGFTEPRGSRKKIGALVLGAYDGDDLVYIGHAGGGLEKSIEKLHPKLAKLARKDAPFRKEPKTNMPVTWIEPELVCEVRFQEWTADGSMRQPIFLGLREDKDPREVRREKERPAVREIAKAKMTESGALIDGRVVQLTNLDKIYWPKEGYAKRDLISYYREIAPVILPHLHDRPESMHRHPEGITGKSFFQKDLAHTPEWARVAEIYSESNRKTIRYLVCQDEATLVYMANLGCIELNPWLSRVDSLDRPDFALFDLDPEEIGFDAVIAAAQEVRKVLDDAGARSFVKTSGATGLHIAVPLGARYEYEQARQFAEIVMRLVHRKLPGTTSLDRDPKKRRRKVYLDFLQNRKGQTMAAPYCVRPRPGAPVSAPLEWPEVKKGLDPAKFTMKNIWRRLEKRGDLWEKLTGDPGIELRKILEGLGG